MQGQKARYEASRKLNIGREKVTELANRLLGDEDSTGLSNGLQGENSKHLSRQEREMLMQNDALGNAARLGRETEDVAISTKVNLAL